MSDKISDETLLLIANDQLDACSLIDVSADIAKELLSRRAAEVKPVKVELFTEEYAKSRTDLSDDYWTGYLDAQDKLVNAIKAAGVTITE